MGEEAGEAMLSLEGEFEAGAGTPTLAGDEGQVEVPVVRGDEEIQEGRMPAPNVLHLDVEGAELDVLRSLDGTFEDGVGRLLYCSVHVGKEGGNSVRDYGETPDDLESYLEGHGFDLERMHRHRDSGNYYLRARRDEDRST